MDAATISAIGAVAVLIIGAVATAAKSVITAINENRVAVDKAVNTAVIAVAEVKQKTDNNTEITSKNAEITKEIGFKVDGHLSKLTDELLAANRLHIEDLERGKQLQVLIDKLLLASASSKGKEEKL